MNKRILILFLFLFPAWSYGQIDSIRSLEAALPDASAAEELEIRATLIDQYLQIGDYDQVAENARDLYEAAREQSNVYYMALALNREGKSFIAENNNRRARKLFSESAGLLQDTEYRNLQIDNLKALKDLAEKTLRRSEAQALEQQITALELERDRIAPVTALRNPIILERPKIAEVIELSTGNSEELNEEIASLNVAKEELTQLLQVKEQQISTMSDERMRVELTLSRQQNLIDSLFIKSLSDSLTLAAQELSIQKKNAEIEIQRNRKFFFMALGAFGLLLAVGLTARVVNIRRHNAVLEVKNKLIEEEKKRSDELLQNILPVTVAEELKRLGAARTRQFDQVTVMFADFKDFSRIAKDLPPEKLVEELDHSFRAFDEIVERHRLEKIKTIGDAYMCVGGLPTEDPTHPQRVIRAAMEFQAFLREWKKQKQALKEPFFEARIGIHTGPIIAGVVGVKKFAYDIWGDTVNIAARMEAAGEPGRINISQTTYSLINEQFECSYRGKVPAKNIGEIDMYFVSQKNGVTEQA